MKCDEVLCCGCSDEVREEEEEKENKRQLRRRRRKRIGRSVIVLVVACLMATAVGSFLLCSYVNSLLGLSMSCQCINTKHQRQSIMNQQRTNNNNNKIQPHRQTPTCYANKRGEYVHLSVLPRQQTVFFLNLPDPYFYSCLSRERKEEGGSNCGQAFFSIA